MKGTIITGVIQEKRRTTRFTGEIHKRKQSRPGRLNLRRTAGSGSLRRKMVCQRAGVALVLAVLLMTTAAGSAEAAGVVAGAMGRTVPEVNSGELLLGELNCVACHEADEAVAARLTDRPAPFLGRQGMRLTPQYLRAFLSEPHVKKPGTPMPDLLHGMAAEEKAETVQALVHYLVSLQPETDSVPPGVDPFLMERGRQLYHKTGCVACHEAQTTLQGLQETHPLTGEDPGGRSSPPEGWHPEVPSVPLGDLASKTTVQQLSRFLREPLSYRPSGRMPSLGLNEDEATAIAMYLVRDQAFDASGPLQKTQGLKYEYYEAGFGDVPDFGEKTVKSTGFVERFVTDPIQRDQNVGLRFTGFVKVPADGQYTFYTASDDGSRLYIGNELVVQNDGHHATTERQGTIELEAGDHPIQVTWFNAGGGYSLTVMYEGPNLEKQEIPASVLRYLGQPMVPLDQAEFALDSEKAEQGRQHFHELGCAACHQVEPDSPQEWAGMKAPPLSELDPEPADGCLGTELGQGRAKYQLSLEQRDALKSVLADANRLTRPLTVEGRVNRTLAAMNCYACHERGGVGGPSPARRPFFTSIGQVDLGDEGRIPPHLNDVGAKLKPDWLREVVVNGAMVRPYMATRMPKFGEANVGHLVKALPRADQAGPVEPPKDYADRMIKIGRQLVGTDGLSCVACHTFAEYDSLGIPAMDLTKMPQRLRWDWFRRYLLDPPSLRPGTRMPSFWPEGRAVNRNILDGKTDEQIEAIRAFLRHSEKGGVPEGLIQGQIELVARDQATIYRNFIAGAGARAIAVGYPEKANLAFDANNLRLALIWKGPFMDAGRHWTGRGQGFEPPLGWGVQEMPPGVPFATLPSRDAPWPEAEGQPEINGRSDAYEMIGYRLDAQRRPTFLYSYRSVSIEDKPVAVAGELEPHFKRTLTLKTDQPMSNLWFRAAVGSQIQRLPEGGYRVEDRMTLKLDLSGSADPLIRRSRGRAELLVPVRFAGGKAEIREEIIW